MLSSLFLFLPRLGAGELILILIVILLLFGAKRIPELMNSFGKGIKSFKKGLNDIDADETPKTQSSDREKTNSTGTDL